MSQSVVLIAMTAMAASAQPPVHPEWNLINPVTTGVPGTEVEFIEFGPDGRLYMGGRWPFFDDAALAIYDVQNDRWENHSNSFGQPFPGVGSPVIPQDIDFAPDGAVWLACRGGLGRLLNGQWTIYTTSNAPFVNNIISDVEVDSNGVVWCLNADAGPNFGRVLRWDGVSWQWWEVGNGLPASWATPWKSLVGLVVDANNTAWVGSGTWSGLARFNGAGWTAIDGGSTMGNLIVDAQGSIWGHNSGLVHRFDGAQWTVISGQNAPINSANITGVHAGRDGRVYITMFSGRVIRQTTPGSNTFEIAYEIGLGFNIGSFDVEALPSGELWVTHYGTTSHTAFIRRISPSGQLIREYNTFNTGMPDYFPRRLSRDPAGNLWMTGEEGGLSRFDGERWRNWGARNAGSEPYPFAGSSTMGGFFMDSTGAGWMLGNGVARWDAATGQFTGFWNFQNTPIFGGQLFTHAAEDAAGNIFASGSQGTVFRFSGGAWSQEPIQGSYQPNFAGVHADTQGNIYVAHTYEIWKWNGAAWSTLPLPDPEYLGNLDGIFSFAVARDDSLWIGTGNGLVHVVNGQFTLYNESNSPMPAQLVVSIAVRDDGLVAASCHTLTPTAPFPSGVSLINGDAAVPGNWTTYSYATHPIYHYQLSAVEFDREGNLWICTSSEGVSIALIGAIPCYANCDASTAPPVLTANDFQCFLNKYASGDAAANCDGSTNAPVLNANDFQCFLNKYAAGCP